jgi:multidrug resistance protein
MPLLAEDFSREVVQLFGRQIPGFLMLGMAMSTYSALQFVCAPIWGRISDRIGRRPVILISVTGSVLSYLIFARADTFWILILSRFVGGIAGANIATAQAYIADITTPETRARGMGLIGAAFGLGFVFGPLFGGLTSGFLGRAWIGYLAALMCAIDLVMAFFMLEESLDVGAARKNGHRRFNLAEFRLALTRPYVAVLCVMFFVMTLGFTQLETMFSIFLRHRFGFGEDKAGYFLGFMGIIMVFVQGFLIGKVVKRFGERKLAVAGTGITAIALFFFPLPHSVLLLGVICVFMALGNGLAIPSINSLISRFTDPGQQGGILGFSQGISSLARVLGPMLAAFAYSEIGVNYPFWLGSLFILTGCLLGLKLFRKKAIA